MQTWKVRKFEVPLLVEVGTKCCHVNCIHSSSSSFICSNQLNKKTHTWSTREQEQDKKGTENWRLHFAYKKTKNKHTRYKNNYDYAYSKNAEKSTRLNLDNDEKSTVWGKKFQPFIILSIKKFLRTELTHLGLYNL